MPTPIGTLIGAARLGSLGSRTAAAAVLLWATACSALPTSSFSFPPSASLPADASPSLPSELEGSEAVEFLSTDGVKLEGRLFGSGSVAVVLAHGTALVAQASWYPFARTLVDHGYLAMTFDFRGFCPGGAGGCSEGTLVPPDTWQDLMGAVELVRERGAEKVFVIGASLGARSCVWAASRPGVDLDGVVGVSTPKTAAAAYSPAYDFTADVIGDIKEPILFVAGDQDETFAAEATDLYEWANEPKQLAIVSSAAHGAPLLQGATAEIVLKFLTDHS